MKKKKQAVLVSFEGKDGLGKSTQVDLVHKELRSLGMKVATAKLPAYERLTGKLIRWMLINGTAVSLPNLFQVCQWFDKLIFQWFVLPKLMRDNDYVLLDRWHASMWVYGLASGANERFTNYIVKTMREPDLVLVFYGTRKRAVDQDRYEADNSFQKSVGFHYILWSTTSGNNTCFVDSDLDKSTITTNIMSAIDWIA